MTEIKYDPVTAGVPGIDNSLHEGEIKEFWSAGDPKPTSPVLPKPGKIPFLEKFGIKFSK